MSLIHPDCSFVCQKEQHTGQRCAASCEFAPYAAGQGKVLIEQQQVVKSCPWEVINPANGPTRYNDLFPEKSPCTCGKHSITGEVLSAELRQHQEAQIQHGIKTGRLPAPEPTQATPSNNDLATMQPRRINVRAKGQRGEREVITILQTVVDRVRAKFGAEKIVLQRNVLQAHMGGCDLHGLVGFAVEVKFVETETLGQWWKQCLRQAEDLSKTAQGVPTVPILFYRASRQPWQVKFRAFVATPLDVNQVEMDLETSLDNFLRWFEDAYEEQMITWTHKLS